MLEECHRRVGPIRLDLPRPLAVMHSYYGEGPAGETCRLCRHFIRYGNEPRGSFSKCDLTVRTGGKASDWKSRWAACGAYEGAR